MNLIIWRHSTSSLFQSQIFVENSDICQSSGSLLEYYHKVWYGKTTDGENFEDMICTRTCDRLQDGQTDTAWRHGPHLCIAVRSKNCQSNMVDRYHSLVNWGPRINGFLSRLRIYVLLININICYRVFCTAVWKQSINHHYLIGCHRSIAAAAAAAVAVEMTRRQPSSPAADTRLTQPFPPPPNSSSPHPRRIMGCRGLAVGSSGPKRYGW